MQPHKSLEDANAEVKKFEDEMVKVIRGKAPELARMFKGSGETGSPLPNDNGLEAITEELDEDEEDLEDFNEDEDDFDYEDEEDDSSKRKIIEDDFDMEDGSDVDNDEDDLDDVADDVQVKAPKHIKCEEDDDFVNMFDKMMNETLNESKVPVPRSQQLDIVAPVHSRANKKVYGEYLFFEHQLENCV